jgi:hypothetical protein
VPGLKYTPAISMKLNISIDSRAVQEAFARAPDMFLSEMERGAKEGLTEIQRDAVRNHRFKRKSGNLEKSVIIDFKSFKQPGTGIRLETGMASYGPYIHQGFKSWLPDPFLYEAAIRGTDQLIQKIVAGIGKAISKIGLKGK